MTPGAPRAVPVADHGNDPAPAQRPLTVIQMLPALHSGGVERGTLDLGRHLVRHGHRSIVISAGGRLCEQLVADGSEHLCWDVGAKRPSSLLWVRRVRALLEARRPDILHLRSRLPAWIGYWAWRGIPAAERPALITSVHGFYSVNRYSAIMTRGERVIAISNSVHDYVLRHYPHVEPWRLRVIPRGVDPGHYPHGFRPPGEWLARWVQTYPQTRGRFIVTLPARLTRLKGHEDFIRITAALKRRGIPVHGLVVGGTEARKRGYEAELRQWVQDAQLEGDITFLGHRSDMREIMSVSDAVLSLSNKPEAFGRTTLEALSMGRPAAGYDHGGVGEQLAAMCPEGRVPPGDWQAMAELLARWRTQPPAVASDHPFTLAKMLASTLDVYREALAGERTTAGGVRTGE